MPKRFITKGKINKGTTTQRVKAAIPVLNNLARATAKSNPQVSKTIGALAKALPIAGKLTNAKDTVGELVRKYGWRTQAAAVGKLKPLYQKAIPNIGIKPKRKKQPPQTGTARGFLQAPSYSEQFDKYYNKHGSVFVTENGGQATTGSLNTMYVNHGIATVPVMESVARALLKKSLNLKGLSIRNWEETIPPGNGNDTSVIVTSYVDNPGTTSASLATFNTTLGNTVTYNQVARDWLNTYQNALAGLAYPREISSIDIYNTQTSPWMHRGQLKGDKIKLNFDISSYLTIQNRTQAENSVGDGDRDESQDIENAPLVGKVYSTCKTWSNGLEVPRTLTTGTSGTIATLKPMVCNPNSGLLTFDSSNFQGTTAYAKPCPGWCLGYKSDRKVVINPGDVYTNKIKFKTSMNLNTFLMKFNNQIQTIPGSARLRSKVEFGQIAGFGLEKILDSSRSAGSTISVGYQSTQVYKCAASVKPTLPSLPINSIGSTSVAYANDS